MRRFQNYHKHTYYSNPYTPDCTVSPKEYAIRAKEVGAELLSSVEHGWCGNVWEYYKTAKENELKLLIGAEAYAVKDRHEADRTNAHICLLAKNENGRQALNDILSEANLTGFYAKPRVDMELLLSLPANDVWVTTACVAGLWRYEDSDELIKKLFEHFREHLFLEVQAHNTESQIALNQHILELSKSLGAKIIAGVDSHYISKDQDKVRTDFLNSKNIFYEEEQGWELDYPDGDELYSRFAKQCVLSHEQIVEAMENTNTFLDVEEYDSPIFETETIKLPSIYPDWTQEQKDAEYQRLVWQGWDNYKNEVPESEWPHYEEEIKKEIRVVLDTGFSDYFLLDYHVVKRGKEKGGILTHAGRGSAVSWITVMLLGMTEVDRIAAKVHMYPQRFATAERILQTKSLFDIDLNQVDSKPFQEAQKEILGEECAYPMLAYGTSQKSAAWKLYAKSQGIPFEVANEVSEQLRRYDMAVKHADEDSKDDIDIYDYIEPKFREIWEGAQDYVGIVTSWSIHPCANLVYSGNIRKEIGLVKIKDNICCCMDGHWAEECHFLKNDFLIVKVLSLIDKAYKEAGIPVPTVNELLRMSPPDDACWDVYAKGATVGINQVEQPGTSARVQVYKPTNISELTAFVAAIRPGFKSMYKKFESREDFSYGIPSFDKLIQTKEFPYSYMLYQEQAMAALNHAGIPMKDCYAAIKNIAKKRVDKVLALKETFISGFEKALIKDGTDKKFAATKAEMVWQIIEDSSRYSFNCVAGSTKIMRGSQGRSKFHPTVAEMYKIKNDINFAKSTEHMPLRSKYLKRYGTALSMFNDLKVHSNNIIDIYYSGKQQTYEMKTFSGSSIICTAGHRFPTPNGMKPLAELNIGDSVYCMGKYDKDDTRYTFTNGEYTPNYPIKGQCGFQANFNGSSVTYYRERNRHIENRDCCEDCGKLWSKSERFELHHIDFDRTNNVAGNYAWLCCSCHKKRHYAHNRKKRYDKGIPTYEDTIVSIEKNIVQDVYDIEMADPAHTFITESGLITSNCSHAYCVALDSLYGAWIKAHYPLAFYKAYLIVQNDKGDKDKMNAAKAEAEDYFGIHFPPFKFGQDNREITANPKTNEITNCLSAIKGFSKAFARNCYECGKQNYKSFIDVLRWFDSRSIKTARLEPLIKIDYFSQYGTIPALMNICDMWNMLQQGNALTVSKKKLDTATFELFKPYVISENIKGKELTLLKITDINSMLYSYEKNVIEKCKTDIPYRVKIQNQLDILGYVDLTTGLAEDRRKLFVTDCTEQKNQRSGEIWAYRIGTKSVGTGKTARLTVRNSVYKKDPIQAGDILYAANLFKNDAGYWYLTDYKHLS